MELISMMKQSSSNFSIAIEAIPGDFTYRVYYLYPDILTLSHLERLSKLHKMLPYFDIPFQHASEKILKLMGRHYDRAHIDAFIEYIRDNFEFIVSFVRVSLSDSLERRMRISRFFTDFIEKYQFESVGIFQYHDESLAASSKLGDKVPDDIAKIALRYSLHFSRISTQSNERNEKRKLNMVILWKFEKIRSLFVENSKLLK
jgi:ribosomal protein S12 methylthiotransferase